MTDSTAIRPFQSSFPESEFIELRRRINATRWPEKETVADIARRATRDNAATRALLGDGL